MAYINVTLHKGSDEHPRRYSATVKGQMEDIAGDMSQGLGHNELAISFGIHSTKSKTVAITGNEHGTVFTISLDREAVRWLTQQFAKYEREVGIPERFDL